MIIPRAAAATNAGFRFDVQYPTAADDSRIMKGTIAIQALTAPLGCGNFGLDAAPADRPALHRAHHRAEQHHVHHLAVVEPLQQQRPQQRPVFVPLEREGHHARQEIDQHEADEEDQRTLHVRGGPELRQMREMELREPPHEQRAEKQQVDHRREQRQQKLEQKHVRQGDPAQRAVFCASQRVAMFPERLQRAERPAETLADQRGRGFRRVGPADRFFLVINFPARATDGDGQIGIFRDGIRGETAGIVDRFGAPRAQRAGNDGNAIQQIERALFQILAGDVFERLPAGEPADAVSDLHVSRNRADPRIDEVPHQFADRVRLNGCVRVDGDDNSAGSLGQRMRQRRRLSADWAGE